MSEKLNTLDIENAKQHKVEWAIKYGAEPLRAIVNAREALRERRIQVWAWVISAGILGFVLGFLLGSYEPSR